MKVFLGIIAVVFSMNLVKAQAITGDWNGLLSTSGVNLRLVFHITKTSTGYTSTMDSPDQGATGIPVTTTVVEGNQLTLEITSAKITYTGTLNEDQTIDGVFTQNGQPMELKLSRAVLEKVEVKRPQKPISPVPYYSEEVKFTNEIDSIQLAGTLTLPSKKGKFPVVVLISGSGPQNRNEELLGHEPFLVIADYLTRNGIGVLRFDDRGVGESKGDFAQGTTEDFATDVEAAIAYLNTRNDVDKKQLGLIGHSEGGIIAPIVASRNSDVAFIVLLAGTGIRGAELLLLQQELIGRSEGASEEVLIQNKRLYGNAFELLLSENPIGLVDKQLRAFLLKELNALPDSLKAPDPEQQVNQLVSTLTSPWMRYFVRFDPATALTLVKCPVLAMNGSKDLQVPATVNLAAIEKALKAGGNKAVTIEELEGLNHLFQECSTGSPSEYAEIEETFSPKALAMLTKWIQEQVR